MKLFECHSCGQVLYFENVRCEHCGHALGYLPEQARMLTLHLDDGLWRPLDDPQAAYIFCGNAAHGACNWLIEVQEDGEGFCASCRLNKTIPDLGHYEYVDRWRLLEASKRRLVYGLLRFDLRVPNKDDEPVTGIAFDLLSDDGAQVREEDRVKTGHDNGLITINIAEADNAEREQIRLNMGEPYRTLLGHFRHEIGHYYWDRLVRDGGWMEGFRATFGDEQRDYGESLKRHYASGPSPSWQESYVSAYASAHPWEDFAETWAHYMHIVDTLETADAFGMRLRPKVGNMTTMILEDVPDPYRQPIFNALPEAWLPLTFAANSLNRSMGQPDIYPFVLTPTVFNKLHFIHNVIYASRGNKLGP